MANYGPLVVKNGQLRELPFGDNLDLGGNSLRLGGNISLDGNNVYTLGGNNNAFKSLFLGTLVLKDDGGTIAIAPASDSTNTIPLANLESFSYNPLTATLSILFGTTTFNADISNSTFDSVGTTTLRATTGIINNLTTTGGSITGLSSLSSSAATITTLSGGALTSSNFASAVSLVIYDSTGSAVKTLYGAGS